MLERGLELVGKTFRVSWGSGGAKMGCAGFELGGVGGRGWRGGGEMDLDG